MHLSKKRSANNASAAPSQPTLPEPIMSMDDRIALENIQMSGFKKDTVRKRSKSQALVGLLAAHPLAAAGAGLACLMLVGLVIFAASHSTPSSNPGSKVASNDGTEAVETYDYDADSQTADPDTGDASDSGTGDLGENTGKPGVPANVSLQAQSYQITTTWQKVSGASQ